MTGIHVPSLPQAPESLQQKPLDLILVPIPDFPLSARRVNYWGTGTSPKQEPYNGQLVMGSLLLGILLP